MTSRPRIRDREAEAARLRALAAEGLSQRQAAQRLGVTKGTVTGRARDLGVRFAGPLYVGGGCNSAQARRGWETRRGRVGSGGPEGPTTAAQQKSGAHHG